MPDTDLSFLDAACAEFKAREKQWERDERRFEGTDDVFDELSQFAGESNDSYVTRQGKATYRTLSQEHLDLIMGHIERKRPVPNAGLDFGALGTIRPKAEVDLKNRAEALWWNADGTGEDGMSWAMWWKAVHARACNTGHRWVLVEAPPVVRDANGEARDATEADERQGHRPYLVEYSPLSVPYWHTERGELQFVIVRVPETRLSLANGALTGQTSQGYYLLVRQGFDGLGAAFSGGGWWLYDSQKRSQSHGTWDRTGGRIPFFPIYGRPSRGTTKQPAMSASLTTQLNRLSAKIMDADSAWFYDWWDACASRLYFLGADPAVMAAVEEQVKNRSFMIGVPPVESSSEAGQDRLVDIFDGSTGTVSADVSERVLASLMEQARDIMVRQLTSTPESSGESKKAGFAEGKEPIIVTIAKLRQQAEAQALYFLQQRWGVPTSGFVEYPSEFDLTGADEAVDAMLDTLRKSKLRSPTLEAKLLTRSAEERGFLSEDGEAEVVLAELRESAAVSVRGQAREQSLLDELDNADLAA